VVCDREHVGFGASGRNGGWCSALFAGARERTVRVQGRAAAIAMQRAMFATLDEIENIVHAEGIDCDWARGGEPLPGEFWAEARLFERETFTDAHRLVIYGQRTADGRLAFGGRGAPYHFGSRVRPQFDEDPDVFAALQRTLRSLFPKLGDARVTHRWGGAVGVPRDWYSSVGFDRATGMGWAGGYVGDGVSTANLAGRTLADLILERDTEITRLPWVGHVSPHWEPEPLRWLGINGGRALVTSIDRAETTGRKPRLRTKLAARVLGG
jgi:glycine/D-amino acid oxidase-like deaminating enzyme